VIVVKVGRFATVGPRGLAMGLDCMQAQLRSGDASPNAQIASHERSE
jgi:hypothetical protein